ncbi:winged helix-turn-helix transcriptional regulator [Candidatus Woesearchaeota archaeon]|nr:winged helix-turn-helix transcriptional regulator [Candidatus Woesearchaeota archaeon]
MELKEEKLSRAISAYSRRQILRLLAEKEMTVTEVCKKTGQSKSLASRHLTMLHDLGFLVVRKEFPHKFYSLKIKELRSLLDVYDTVIEKI